jgi:hypothetical protein
MMTQVLIASIIWHMSVVIQAMLTIASTSGATQCAYLPLASIHACTNRFCRYRSKILANRMYYIKSVSAYF